MKTISLPGYNRPDALRRMLKSLRRNNTKGWSLVISADGGPMADDHCTMMIRAINWMHVKSFRHNVNLGLTLNTFLAPSLAFASGSDFNLYLEDDLLLSPDALDLCNWYQEQFTSSVGLTLWRSHASGLSGHSNIVGSSGQGGHGNGFACHRHQWESFWRKEWFSYGLEAPGHQWDIATDVRLRELGNYVLSPLVPRSVQQRGTGTHASDLPNPLHDVVIYDGPAIKEFRLV